MTGPVSIKDLKKISTPEGSEVFSEKKGLNIFKDKVGQGYKCTTHDAYGIHSHSILPLKSWYVVFPAMHNPWLVRSSISTAAHVQAHHAVSLHGDVLYLSYALKLYM